MTTPEPPYTIADKRPRYKQPWFRSSSAADPNYFWSKCVNGPGGCLLWTGAKVNGGYGVVRMDRKLMRAHRYSWELTNGPVPDGLIIMHKCDVRLCVNPEHLALGTRPDNSRDAVSKLRILNCQDHPHAKLTDAIVRRMRGEYASGRRIAEMAAEVNVTPGTVRDAVTGKTWKHLEARNG